MMCFVMPIWTLLQHADVDSLKTCYLSPDRLESVNKWLGLTMLLFVFPTQWMLGINYITYETGDYSKTHSIGYFLGHYFPGYCFMISGVGIIWCSGNMDKVMKGEIFMLAPAALIAMAGELSR